MTDIQKLAGMIDEASYIVFFGGAGVSTESGIPDFRSADGLYHQKRVIPPETILSYSFFIKEPALFYQFYKENLLAPKAQPNAAHVALAQLEKEGKLRCVVTQNIDNLHQLAGSKAVCELHGSTHHNYCMRCGKTYDGIDFILASKAEPKCACGGMIRPDVVLYEEGLDPQVTQTAVNNIQASDLLIIGGTSLSVYPAAYYAQLSRGKLVIINRDPTQLDQSADLVIREPIGKTLAQVMEARKTA